MKFILLVLAIALGIILAHILKGCIFIFISSYTFEYVFIDISNFLTKFYSVFAGEMSWGDEPNGDGYQLLKNLDRVGVLSLIEKLSIPSQSLSVQFIKE